MNSELVFLKSALALETSHSTIDSAIDWIKHQNAQVNVDIEPTNLDRLAQWNFRNGGLRHDSGQFFSIEGIRVQTNWSNIPVWDQPIINQPEIGYLGFIAKEIDGVLNFLCQAKIEPGNINQVQISPTLQATKSNYTGVHKGKQPEYLEYFQQAERPNILLDQLQSEQGARFLRKRNRNMIILVDSEIEVLDNYRWLTLGQIKHLMQLDNLVNMDSRTVLSCIRFGSLNNYLKQNQSSDKLELDISSIEKDSFLFSALAEGFELNRMEDILTFLTHLKCKYELNLEKVDLNQLNNWVISDDSIHHIDNRFFKIIGVDVQISNREVHAWSQPMVQPEEEGICAFIIKKINGVCHFLVQAKLECGNFDTLEFAPTVQCLTGGYKNINQDEVPYLTYVLNATEDQKAYDIHQSEEGGRFYREQNRNLVVWADESFSEEVPENYIWMTLHQMFTFTQFNNYLNIQARSLMAAINYL